MNKNKIKIEYFYFLIIIMYSFKYINKRIQKEICKQTIFLLNDQQLLPEYIKTKSVQNKIQHIVTILDKYKISSINQQNITNELVNYIIPSGTKGVIKGNKFNNIVKEYLLNINFDKSRYTLKFETKLLNISTINEIPDWYIYDNISRKYLIGMNQVDLWNGGHQLNRGYKYIHYNNIHLDHKIICVICNHINISNKNKIYSLFNKGFTDNSICYLNNLQYIIINYFNNQ